MKHKIININSYNFTDKDRLFLDANIWLYLRGPQKPHNRKERIYSNTFKRIKIAKSQIYIDVLIVSEYINTYARRKWSNVGRRFNYFKSFRNSPTFTPIANDIAADTKWVLQHCKLIESEFVGLIINDLLDDYAKGGVDYNDQVFTELCKNNGYTLITDDGDFNTHEIPILTANRSLLKK